MSTNRARSLSERLDRDGPESAARRARELGGDAPKIARDFAALQEKLGALRAIQQVPVPSAERLDEVVSKIVERAAAAGEGEDVSAWRRPAFPQTEEEAQAMADEETTGPTGAEGKASSSESSARAGEGAARVPATAVRRAKEAAPTDSGVVNLKALAEDYFRAKAARAEVVAKPAEAAAGVAAPPAGRRRAMGPLLAIAAGLVAVFAVVLYLFLRGRVAEQKAGTAPSGGAVVATGPALLANEPAGPPARIEAPPPNATAEEIERYRREVEQLRRQLAEQQKAGQPAEEAGAGAKAAPSAASGEAAERPAGSPSSGGATPRRTTGGSSGATGGMSRSGATGGAAAPGNGTAAGTPAGTPPANPLIHMLGGRSPAETTSGTGSSGGSDDSSTSTSGSNPTAGDSRLAGSLSDLGITAPARATTTAPAAAPTPPPAAAPPPPPPPPPEEALPETLGRPEIRRGTDQVKSAVLRCGQGQPGGTITVEFTVNGADGSVSGARVTGEFAGTAVGACAESAARGATFSRFRRSTFTFTFPFVLPTQ